MSKGDAAAIPSIPEVPYRVQLPGTGCAFYAVGMVMDYWHGQDPNHPTALVCDKDVRLRLLDKNRFRFEPTTPQRILDFAQEQGLTDVHASEIARNEILLDHTPLTKNHTFSRWWTCIKYRSQRVRAHIHAYIFMCYHRRDAVGYRNI